MPSAAIAATRHQRDTSLARPMTNLRQQAERVDDDEDGEADEKQRQRRPRARAVAAVSRNEKRNREHRRQQHRHPQQLDIGGDVAGFVRNRVAGADDLRDVMDRAADEDARLLVVEADRRREHGIENHRQRRQRGDADHGEDRVALPGFAARQDGGDRQRRRSAADRDRAAREDAEHRRQAEPSREQEPEHDRRRDADDHRRHRPRAERSDLAERDAHAEQADADAQTRSAT